MLRARTTISNVLNYNDIDHIIMVNTIINKSILNHNYELRTIVLSLFSQAIF